jgi:hypothetical protein
MATPLPSFVAKPEQYGLYNPSEEFIDLMWAGKSMRLPGCKDISRAPCKFVDGAPIPGTLVIEDSYTHTAEGSIPQPGSAFNWKAADAIRNLLGIDIETGEARSTKAAKGITFLPPVIDRDTFKVVQSDAERRYGEHLIGWAEEYIQGFESRVAKAKEAGFAAPAPDPDYNRALVIQKKHMDRLGASMPIEDRATKVAEDMTDFNEEAAIMAEAMAMAKEAAEGKEIDEKQLAEKLVAKPEIRRHLARTAKQKYSIRKKGHLPDEEKAPEPEKVE